MYLGKYGIKIKKYLKESYPIKYNELIINCTLMDYVCVKEQELFEYFTSIEEQLKRAYPAPKTSEFIVMARYNNMIKSMVEEYVINKMTKIMQIKLEQHLSCSFLIYCLIKSIARLNL